MPRRTGLHLSKKSGWFFLSVSLLVLFLSGSPAAADESVIPAEADQPDKAGSILLDEYHTFLLGRIKGQTLWFDNFFGDRRLEEDDLPTSFVRLRTVVRYTEGEGLTFPIRLRANLKLPRVNRRLHLVIFGGNRDEDRLNEPDDAIDSTLKTDENTERTNLGLRYVLFKSLRDRFHFGGGLSLGWPLDYYGRMRYERLLHVSDNSLIRFTETGFWNSLNGFGETSRIDLEKTLGDRLSGRLSLFGTYSEDVAGLQWGVETSLFRQITEQSALALDLGAYGTSQPRQVDTYRLAGRYRRNFLRPWLFFEIEPEVTFPRSASGRHEAVGALTTVLEIQFLS